ncbi:hypothetical protein EDD27_4111 [Nonomuraea polychroma]|uniref:Uncharacterized protein n=1 Tax=Nonomuraea polychroma TaxID=46176 RepID=A0A438M771_9ACTN|nr:hypothetical protein EDD27_4111 [Nonomuraea polychroma]
MSESATAPPSVEIGERCRVLLEQFNNWLQATVPQQPHLVGIVPVAIQAIQLYRTKQYDACIGRLRDAAEILRLVGYPAPIQP